jgi:hypothetical protein
MATQQRRLTPATHLPGREPPRLGHNQGPALDAVVSWRHVAWRKSYRRVWRQPPAEVARRRSERAGELGLSYRQYTSVLLDRGVRVEALAFTAGALMAADGGLRPGVWEKLATLSRCRVLLPTDAAQVLAARLDGAGRDVAAETGSDPVEWLRRLKLPPAAAVLVGDGEAERALGTGAGVGLYLWRQAYFGADIEPLTSGEHRN